MEITSCIKSDFLNYVKKFSHMHDVKLKCEKSYTIWSTDGRKEEKQTPLYINYSNLMNLKLHYSYGFYFSAG